LRDTEYWYHEQKDRGDSTRVRMGNKAIGVYAAFDSSIRPD